MNKKEWHSGTVEKTFKWKRLVQQKIKEWKISNNVTEKCDITFVERPIEVIINDGSKV